MSNPLKQDTQNGKPRFYSWGNMLFNYGFFPQTCKNNTHAWHACGMILCEEIARLRRDEAPAVASAGAVPLRALLPPSSRARFLPLLTLSSFFLSFRCCAFAGEDPDSIPSDTGCPGDNDPVDCLELSSTPLKVGSLVSVKILGVLGLIDDGETDWKVICINVADPLADQLNDVSDVESVLPGAISAVRDWFRDYKSASGKINSYALEGRCMPRDYALNVLAETHKHWQHLHLERKQSIIGESLAQLDARRPSPAPAACISGETEQPISFHGPEDLPQ